MPNDIDLSDDTLLHRREMAKRVASWKPALFGPNQYDDSYSLRNGKDDAVIRCHGSGVDGKDDLASHLAAFILFNPPEAVMAHIDEILRLRNELAATECRGERDDLEAQVARLEGEVERLEREADWLAHNVCKGCPPVPPERLPDCDNEEHPHDCPACWRRAARKAVEKKA